jgi:hypothetical protein
LNNSYGLYTDETVKKNSKIKIVQTGDVAQTEGAVEVNAFQTIKIPITVLKDVKNGVISFSSFLLEAWDMNIYMLSKNQVSNQ